jgi:Ca2+-binding EF-hand superfamily protein
MEIRKERIMATLTEIDISEPRKAFESCDLNGDGFIDTAEFHALLWQLDGDVTSAESQLNFEAADTEGDPPPKQTNIKTQAADTEGDGYIGFKEFVAWWTN